MHPTKRQIATIAGATAVFLITSYLFTLWSYSYSSTTQFCISCHEMVEPYKQYQSSAHFNNESGVVTECADCHLPPGTVNKWYTKIKQGATDSFMHVMIKLDLRKVDHKKWKTDAVKNIGSKTCQKCHKNLLPPGLHKGGFIAHRAFLKGETENTCLKCHENLVHVNRN